ncbi:MAG TPA: tyrosine--tRNA ligase [Polyangiaceae bacterium]|nr:tyrosine--tRNA ligase [Polyangiaceae bacterium]
MTAGGGERPGADAGDDVREAGRERRPAAASAEARAQLEVFARGAAELVVEAELLERIEAHLSGRRGPLRVKAGFDPTRPDLHLGHVVLLQKMRQIQDLGHHIVFVVGDTTAMVGDPTGQNEARPRLTREAVLEAAKTYQAQCFKVLDAARTEVRYNGEWLGKMSVIDLIELSAKATLARILERDDFSKRVAEQRAVYMHELLYPLLQAYDSVALDCDLELGGTDQFFNLNVGRDLMPRYGKPPQCVLTTPLLEGLDARLENGRVIGKKMSKSADNYIGIAEPPVAMFKKAMQIDDGVVWRYFELLSSKSAAEIAALRAQATDPREPKRLFGREIVARFHGPDAAREAEAEFDRVYLKKGGVPDDVPEFEVAAADASGLWIAKALSASGLAPTTGEGKRMVSHGYVEVDGARVTDDQLRLPAGGRYLLRSGSKTRRFAYVVVSAGAGAG